MLNHPVRREVALIIPMSPNMELVATQTASVLATLMGFGESDIDEIQLALIEMCINAFEHSKSPDNRVFIRFIMGDDGLELKIADHGVGFQHNAAHSSNRKMATRSHLKQRGWGLEIARNMMDHISIESGENGTIITMMKKLYRQKEADAGSNRSLTRIGQVI